MANTDKDIVITPNRGQAAAPAIVFIGGNNIPGTLTVNDTGTLTYNRQFISSVATGTAPFAVSSTTRVANMNVATAGTADTWTIARTLTIGSSGKSVNGSANVSWSLAELGAAAVNQTMHIGTTAVTINRASGALALTGVSIDGNAGTATALQTARTIGGVSFNGTANINLPGVNVAGNQNTTGNAATATALQTARTINGVSFNGTANITVADATKLPLTGGSLTGSLTLTGNATSIRQNSTVNWSGNAPNGVGKLEYHSNRWYINAGADSTLVAQFRRGESDVANINNSGVYSGSIAGNAATATALQTARLIGGVSFNGTANINLPGVNTAGNQSTTGNAATATALQTARTINGISFNGTAAITLPTVNTSGNQTVGGTKTFSAAVVLSTAGTATTHAVRADRNIATGTGLSGGGNLTANRTFAVDSTVIRTTGNQTVGGIKTFSNSVVFDDLKFRRFSTSTATVSHFRKYTDIIHYANSSSTVAGNLRIELPVTTSTMWTMDVVIVEYDNADTPIKTTNLTITAYTTNNANRSVLTNNPDRITQVRFGRNTANNRSVILITPASTFRYPKAYIKEINTHHSNETTFAGSANYGITITTDETDFVLNGTIINNNFIRDTKLVNNFGNQTVAGVKTFSSAVVLSTAGTATTHAVRADRNIATGSGLSGGGNLTANRTFAVDSTVIRTTGNQTASGIKTFSTQVVGKVGGVNTTPSFTANTTGGSFATMFTRRGGPFHSFANHSGSSYAPFFVGQYQYTGGAAGVYSLGHLTVSASNPGTFCIHHINSAGGDTKFWGFNGINGTFSSPGAITAAGDITAFSSDRRLKENIQPIENSLAKVLQLTGVTYDWKDTVDALGFTPPIRKNDAGLIAQDVQQVLPQAVAPAPFDQDPEGKSLSGDDYLTVKYEKLVPLLVEAIKELNNKICQLENCVNQTANNK